MKTILENENDFICDIQTPCFNELTEEERSLVKNSKIQVLFKKGDNLSKQGTFANYVLFLIKGIAKQYVESNNDKNYNIRIIQSGEFIGLSSVFSKNTFSYSSMAITECQAYLIEKDIIINLIKTNGEFGLKIIKRYCEQNTNLYSLLDKVLFKQMNGRLADVLLYLNSLKANYPNIFQLLPRKEIADFAGISVESTIKLLKSLEKDNILHLNEKDILIRDLQKIEKISKIG